MTLPRLSKVLQHAVVVPALTFATRDSGTVRGESSAILFEGPLHQLSSRIPSPDLCWRVLPLGVPLSHMCRTHECTTDRYCQQRTSYMIRLPETGDEKLPTCSRRAYKSAAHVRRSSCALRRASKVLAVAVSSLSAKVCALRTCRGSLRELWSIHPTTFITMASQHLCLCCGGSGGMRPDSTDKIEDAHSPMLITTARSRQEGLLQKMNLS